MALVQIPASGGLSWTQVATGSLTGASVTVSSLSGNEFIVLAYGWSHDNTGGNQTLRVRLNNDSGSNYFTGNTASIIAGVSDLVVSNLVGNTLSIVTSFLITMAGDAEEMKAVIPIGLNTGFSANTGGIWYNSAAVNSITLFPSGGSFDNGTYYIYKR